VRVDRQGVALPKTYDGPDADNNRTKELERRIADGERISMTDDIYDPSVKKTLDEVRKSGSPITEYDVRLSGQAQAGDLFDIQHTEDTARRASEFEGSAPPATDHRDQPHGPWDIDNDWSDV